MNKKIGNALILAGTLLITASVALMILFYTEDKTAQKSSSDILNKITSEITYNTDDGEQATPDNKSTLNIDGNEYIGYISIPSLTIELPVMSDWDYDKMNISPCRYYGSSDANNLVIAAHNYTSHFSKLSELNTNDDIYLTLVDGSVIHYSVVASDILVPSEVEEMINSNYDLTLFTCTYGAGSRITVRCNRTK